MDVHTAVVRPLTSHLYKARTEHAVFSPDQALTSSSAKHREVFGESHEGCPTSCEGCSACCAYFLAYG
ncbi:unnamed protein product [Ectocarpus sp. 4 AP-2014]